MAACCTNHAVFLYRTLLSIQINVRDLPVDVSATVMYEGDANELSETTSASAETQVTLVQVTDAHFFHLSVHILRGLTCDLAVYLAV